MSKGVVAAICAAFSAGMIPIFTKLMMNAGLTSAQVLFFRYMWVFIMAGGWMMIRKKSFHITRKQLCALFFFTVAGYGGATFLLASSFNFLSVGLATMLYFTYPMFVMLIMTLLFKEKPTKIKTASLLLAVFGILWLMNFDFSIVNIGSVLAVGAGLAYGVYLVGIRKSSMKNMDNMAIVFYLAGISCVLFFGQGCLTGTPDFLTIGPLELFYGLILGFITVFVLGVVAFAIKAIGPTKTSLIISFEAVVSLVMGILVFSEPYGVNTWVGSILMTLSVIFITRENTEEALVAAEK